MATKVFSSRADEDKLAFANAVAQRDMGMSFAQYCGSVLLDLVNDQGKLPMAKKPHKENPFEVMRAISEKYASSDEMKRIARLNDQEIKDLIASRYEA